MLWQRETTLHGLYQHPCDSEVLHRFLVQVAASQSKYRPVQVGLGHQRTVQPVLPLAPKQGP